MLYNNFKASNIAGLGAIMLMGMGKQQKHCSIYDVVTALMREIKHFSGAL